MKLEGRRNGANETERDRDRERWKAEKKQEQSLKIKNKITQEKYITSSFILQ